MALALLGLAATAAIGVTSGVQIREPRPGGSAGPAPQAPAATATPTLAPTETPTPWPSLPASTPVPSATAAVPAPSAEPRNLLVSGDGSLRVPVGTYADCTGASPVPRNAAELDPCFAGRYYFVGHNPGVFSPLMHLGAGDVIVYYDAAATVHRFRLVAWRVMVRNSGALTLPAGVTAQFQTCEAVDGSTVRVLDAVSDTA